MKGIGKALARTPFAVTSKIGMSKKSTDTEFDDYNRHFMLLEKASESLIKSTKSYSDAVSSLFTSATGFASHFAVVFQPISGEYDLIGKNPDSERTLRNITKYETAMDEMRSLIGPELELINTRILGPAKELQSVMKLIRKTITKREHKLTDYDRFNNSLTKLRDKKEKSLSDEKNLFKLEQDFEVATNEYEYINTALKQDIPRFMQLATQFVDPLFNSLFYMQLNIYYLILEKMNSFAEEGKYDVSNISGAQIAQEYEEKRTDAWHIIENFNIVKRIISVSRLMQAQKAQGVVGRPSTLSSSANTDSKAGVVMPMPSTAAPPPYTPSSNKGNNDNTVKRAPPPPPPLKSKPTPAPQVQYVVALFDFVAQADGDLSFNAGDRIELIEKTGSSEDWWTGRVNGAQGVFPGNYVQEC